MTTSRGQREMPAHPGARDFLYEDMKQAFSRIVPADASVLEVGCGEGDLLAALPNARRMGIDYLPDAIARARARHPDISFEVGDATAGAGARIESAASGSWDAVICDWLCHSVLDVKALLTGLKRQLAPDGRIYLTAFNYLWELPVRLAELTGWKRPAPTSNWLSDSDFRNLFDIVGLEVVRYEDRLLLPLEVPGISSALNRYLVRAPGMQFAVDVPDLRAARSRHGGARRGGPASASSCRRATRRATSRRRSRARR